MTESVLRLRGRSALFDSMGAGWAMSPGDIALKIWLNRFSKLHLNFSSAPPSFTKQIYGPTKNRQAETFLQSFCHFCYSSFTCTAWSELENRVSSCK
ncbi:hypothetical protein Bca4012_089119 [Brassica carinata]|uniref:Uncharacterized protein n=3 Tax=Brassica TaxID=3705 RepID=A0A0D3A974_BRAOL|nr:hypothetical protein Bca52824_087333 [Brassica carinata]CAF2074374.1 unnamed protein product [Brassica napus]